MHGVYCPAHMHAAVARDILEACRPGEGSGQRQHYQKREVRYRTQHRPFEGILRVRRRPVVAGDASRELEVIAHVDTAGKL